MSEDFSSDYYCQNPVAYGDGRFHPQNSKTVLAGAGQTRTYPEKLHLNQFVTSPYRPDRPGEELPEMLQRLHSCKPLRCSGNQRELARQALSALKNRNQEDIQNLAKRLADDVAGAVD
jgi:hypothetical protein